MGLSMQLNIVSKDSVIYSGQVDSIIAPGIGGVIDVRNNHQPLLVRLIDGEIRVQSSGEEQRFCIGGGMMEVRRHLVTILANEPNI